jgi:hypothetical protein
VTRRYLAERPVSTRVDVRQNARVHDPRDLPPVDPWPQAPLSHGGPPSTSFTAVDATTVPGVPARRRRLRPLLAAGVAVLLLGAAGVAALAVWHPAGARAARSGANDRGGIGAALPAGSDPFLTAGATTAPPTTAAPPASTRASPRASAKTSGGKAAPPPPPGGPPPPPRVYHSGNGGGSLDTEDQFLQVDLEARAGQAGDLYDFGFNVGGIKTVGSGRIAHWSQATPSRPENCEAGIANGALQAVPLSQLAENQLYCVKTVEGRYAVLHVTRVEVSSGMLVGLLFDFTLWKKAGDA